MLNECQMFDTTPASPACLDTTRFPPPFGGESSAYCFVVGLPPFW